MFPKRSLTSRHIIEAVKYQACVIEVAVFYGSRVDVVRWMQGLGNIVLRHIYVSVIVPMVSVFCANLPVIVKCV